MRATDGDLADLDAANADFAEEAARYGLRYRCEDCAHRVSVGVAATVSCSMGFPNRCLTGDETIAIEADGRLVFCKHFELGEQG